MAIRASGRLERRGEGLDDRKTLELGRRSRRECSTFGKRKRSGLPAAGSSGRLFTAYADWKLARCVLAFALTPSFYCVCRLAISNNRTKHYRNQCFFLLRMQTGNTTRTRLRDYGGSLSTAYADWKRSLYPNLCLVIKTFYCVCRLITGRSFQKRAKFFRLFTAYAD